MIMNFLIYDTLPIVALFVAQITHVVIIKHIELTQIATATEESALVEVIALKLKLQGKSDNLRPMRSPPLVTTYHDPAGSFPISRTNI